MRDKEFVTLCRALDLKPNDSVFLVEEATPEKRTVVVVKKVCYDSETGVAYLQTLRDNIILASSILSIERNRALTSKS